MISIVRWSGTPNWLLCQQQYTIFSETRKTSSVLSIYLMVSLVIILGSSHLPRAAGHNIEEHWKDNVHRKKSPDIPAHEQRRSHGLHLSPRTFQKENNRISPNRSTTNVEKRDRSDKSTLHPTKGVRIMTKDEAMNAESRDAVTADSFSPQIPSKGPMVTKRKSMDRKASASFWKSHETSKETVSRFHVRSTESSTPVMNQKEFHSQEHQEHSQLTNNIQKSIRSQFTITPGQKEVTPNQPVIDPHLSGDPSLSIITRKSKDKSPDASAVNIESSTAKQDDITDSLKPSWSPFSSKFHGFQRNHMPSTRTQTPPKKLNSHASVEPIVSTVIQKRSSLTPLYMDKRTSATGGHVSPINKEILLENDIPNTGTSSPALMTSVTTRAERKRQRRKKGRNKNKKRRKMKKTDKKKQRSNLQPVSTDKAIFPNTGQMSATKKQAIEDQNKQRLKTSSTDDSTGNPSSETNTPMAESKTSTSLQVPDIHQDLDKDALSAGVNSDQLNEIDYTEITEGSVDDELARLEETQSEFRAFQLDRNQKWLETNSKKQFENARRLFRTGLPPDDHNEPDLPSQTNRSPSVRRFITKKRKGRLRHRNSKNNFFQKAEPTDFEASESSGEDQIEKDFSRLQFAKISTVLKTTVKRSARPVDAITPIPDKKKSVTDSKRWKFQMRERENKTNDSYIPNRETRVGDKTPSSSDSDTVKQLVVHSKGHSLFDHDGSARDEHTKASPMAELNKQTTELASALYPLTEDNGHTLKSKTSSPLSEIKSVSMASSSPISDLIGSYGRKDPLHATTVVYDSSKTFASVSFAYGEKHPGEKKVGLLVTQPPYSVINDTTQVPSHFSSRIIRGTDGSKSSQRRPATASSSRDRGQSSVDKTRKTGAQTEKGVNIPPLSTFASSISPVRAHMSKSPTLSSTEITPVQFTPQSAGSSTLSQRSAVSFDFTQHVTMSSRQTDNPTVNTHVQNRSKVEDAHSSPTPSTITIKDSSDTFTLHKEKANETMNDEVSVKEQSTSISTRPESENASTTLSAIWTPPTPGSKSNKQTSETHSTNKPFTSTEAATTELPKVLTHNRDTDKSRLFVTSTRTSDTDIKSISPRVISHDDQHYSLHPTTSSPPPPFLTSSTSKPTLSESSTTKSVETRSYPATKSSFPISSSSSEDIHKMITTSPLVHRTTDTMIEVSSVTNKRQHNQDQSTTKPPNKQPQSTTTEPTKIPSTTFSVSPTTKSIATTHKIRIESGEKTSKGTDITTRKSIKPNNAPTSTFTTENLPTTSGRKTTKNRSVSETTTLPIRINTNNDELHSTPDSVSPKPKDDQSISPSPPDSPDYEELLVKCKVKSNIDINGNDFTDNIKNGLVYSYLEGRILLNQRKAGSTNKRRKREAIGYVLEQNIDTHAIHFVDTEGIEAKILGVSRREQLVEINFQMLEYGLIIATDTAIKVFSQLQITEISVNLHYPIYHPIEAIKHVMFQSQQPLKPSTTKWMMVTIAAPSIPVLCVICILLTSWYRNHARLRRKAMAEISRGSQYAESLADVGLEIDMEKGEIVSRAGSTSVLWTEFAAGDTLERMGMAGDFPNTDGESSPSSSWNARGESRTAANQGGRGRRQSPVARQCQRNGKYVKKKDSISSFHFENNLEDEWLGCLLSTDYIDSVDLKNEWLQLQTFQKYSQQANNEQNSPPVYESFEPALNDAGQWPKTSTLQSRTNSGRHLIDQQRKENSSKSQIYGESVIVSSQKLRPTLHANIISHFLADLDTM